MAKTFDFTDKLTTDDIAKIKIGDTELEVKIDTETVFKGLAMSEEDMSIEQKYKSMHELLFTKDSAKKLTALKLPWASYQKLVESAFQIALGNYEDDEAQGEQWMPGMTS